MLSYMFRRPKETQEGILNRDNRKICVLLHVILKYVGTRDGLLLEKKKQSFHRFFCGKKVPILLFLLVSRLKNFSFLSTCCFLRPFSFMMSLKNQTNVLSPERAEQ